MPILHECSVFIPDRLTHIAARMLLHARRTWPEYVRLHPTVRREIEAFIADCETSALRYLAAGTKADAAERRALSNQPGRIGTADAAEVLGCSEAWMRERAARGDLGAVKDRNRWTYDAEAVLAEAEEEEQRRRAA
ncbi:hypothetical protein [Streptomyces sp. TLI_185]|uniref:hypothetical protein n=1 Tax=Streptomyces sp. TLI_185 TaxID=2485151 RepID=UPI000F4F0DDE|nr:hypothetical protein [Streptomyces sp. TLI_185]RPF33427.1 hypothetical protein EDD92_3339 [Streptomyces sp. TLI_185]